MPADTATAPGTRRTWSANSSAAVRGWVGSSGERLQVVISASSAGGNTSTDPSGWSGASTIEDIAVTSRADSRSAVTSSNRSTS